MIPRRSWIALASLSVTLLIAAGWVIARSRRHAPASARSPQRIGADAMPGMDMTGKGSVRLTATQLRQLGVTFDVASVRALTSDARATGVVTFDETRTTQVALKFGGFAERLYVNATGQAVRKGQPLLEVYSPDLISAQQELLVAAQLQRDVGPGGVPDSSGVEGSSSLADATKRRLRLWDVSDNQIDDVLRSGHVRRTITLYVPSSGVIAEKRVVQGQSIVAGEPLYTIADLSQLWLEIQLREADAAMIRIGTIADVELAAAPGRTLRGIVSFVFPTVDSMSRTVRARVVVPNADHLLKPGMYASVRLSTPARSALTVPTSAVLRTGERDLVFVDMGAGELMPQEVRLGRTGGQYSEILAGLAPGQRVVTSPQFLLDSEANLGEVMSGMMAQPHPAAPRR